MPKPLPLILAACAAVLLATPAAAAGPLDLDVQLRYDLIGAKLRGRSGVWDGNLSTSYNLGLRPQIRPGSTLMADLNVNTSETAELSGRQNNSN